MTRQQKIKCAQEAVMIATGKFAVTVDELTNPVHITQSVIMARRCFLKLMRTLKLMYDLETAKFLGIDTISELKMQYDQPLGTTEFIWYNKAQQYYSTLVQHAERNMTWQDIESVVKKAA